MKKGLMIMKKLMNKIAAMLMLAIVTFTGIFPAFGITAPFAVVASAAEEISTAAFPSLSSSRYIEAYTIQRTGRVYGYYNYSNGKFSNKGPWIDAANDVNRIIQFSGDNKAVLVSIPTSSGRVNGWFSVTDFFPSAVASSTKYQLYKCTQKTSGYRGYDGNGAGGSVYVNDVCYAIRSVNGYQLLAMPLTGTDDYRLIWITQKNFTNNFRAVTRTSSAAQTSSSYADRVNAFLSDSRFKNGASYAAGQHPMLVNNTGWSGCAAYAVDFCKYVFGKNSPYEGKAYSNINEARAGDIIKVVNAQHWLVVLSRNGNILYVAEGNWSGKVSVSNGSYTIQNNALYRDGAKFRTFSTGYHMQ